MASPEVGAMLPNQQLYGMHPLKNSITPYAHTHSPSHPPPPSLTGPLVAALLPSSYLLCRVNAWSPADVRLLN